MADSGVVGAVNFFEIRSDFISIFQVFAKLEKPLPIKFRVQPQFYKARTRRGGSDDAFFCMFVGGQKMYVVRQPAIHLRIAKLVKRKEEQSMAGLSARQEKFAVEYVRMSNVTRRNFTGGHKSGNQPCTAGHPLGQVRQRSG